jgi:hypothetical protein
MEVKKETRSYLKRAKALQAQGKSLRSRPLPPRIYHERAFEPEVLTRLRQVLNVCWGKGGI